MTVDFLFFIFFGSFGAQVEDNFNCPPGGCGARVFESWLSLDWPGKLSALSILKYQSP